MNGQEAVLCAAFQTIVEWYELKFATLDIYNVPHPIDLSFDDCKEIIWEVEEEYNSLIPESDLKECLEDAYFYTIAGIVLRTKYHVWFFHQYIPLHYNKE